MSTTKIFDESTNQIYVGNSNKLIDWCKSEDEQTKTVERVRLMLKNYLELDNVSFLFGSGSSIHLGAVSIRNFPSEIEEHVKSQNAAAGKEGVYDLLIDVVKKHQTKFLSGIKIKLGEDAFKQEAGEEPKLVNFKDESGWEYEINEDIIRIKSSQEIAVEFEAILNYLIADDYLLDTDTLGERTDKVKELITLIKEGLFLVCNVEDEARMTPATLIKSKEDSQFPHQNELSKHLKGDNKYFFHERFIKALLQRPLNLRRASIFTSNYDLAFEYAFDRLGVHYIDGFTGFHKRFFKPETFEFDLFYPGSTTSGKVQRIEKVVRYFKLHGSISWVNSSARDANNLYGIEELPLPLIQTMEKKGEIIVYPSAVKKSYTLDLPYSELFRQFAATITQSQSVLVTVGYSFADEHFNDIIFQALSNPTFTLIIVDFAGTKSSHIKRIMDLDDPRIIILQGDFFGDFLTLATTLMPDFNGIDNNSKIAKTLNEYFSEPKNSGEQ